MKAMILAAGKGQRMLSELPKPLHKVEEFCLIEHRIFALASSGITEVIINLHHQAERIQAQLGDGSEYGIKLTYSIEDELQHTGGGIVNALPLLGDDPFIVVNADVWTDFDFANLQLPSRALAHLVLVDNPRHHPEGDFCLRADGKIGAVCRHRLTYSGISMMCAEFFEQCPNEPFSLGPWLKRQIANGVVSGEHHQGIWVDVGTQERLGLVNEMMTRDKLLKRAVGHDFRG